VRYSFENGDDLNEQKIPKFFLLPLVENALKHNRETMDLKIVVRTYMDNQYLVTEVWDSGKPFPEDMNWNSGLRGTDSMLQAYFGKEYTFSFHQSPQKMVQVKIKIDAKDI
jgi:sensor histidine kinase YesM